MVPSAVVMKLMSHHEMVRTHVRDLVGVGFLNSSWLTNLPRELANRLKVILDTPDA